MSDYAVTERRTVADNGWTIFTLESGSTPENVEPFASVSVNKDYGIDLSLHSSTALFSADEFRLSENQALALGLLLCRASSIVAEATE